MRMMSLAKTQEAKLEVAELKVIFRNRFINNSDLSGLETKLCCTSFASREM